MAHYRRGALPGITLNDSGVVPLLFATVDALEPLASVRVPGALLPAHESSATWPQHQKNPQILTELSG